MSDRGEYSPIARVLVDGPDFQQLSSVARHCFLTLKIVFGPSGIEVHYRGALASELEHRTGWSEPECRQAIAELEAHDWIRIEGNVVWIVQHLRYHPHMKASNANHRQSIAAYLEGLPRLAIVDAYRAHYREFFPDLAIPSGTQSTAIPDGMGDGMGDTIDITKNEERKTKNEVRRTNDEGREPSASRPIGEKRLENQLARRLPSDSDRVALTALVQRVPNPSAWLGEIAASLDGMPGHTPLTPEQLGEAIRDYIANGASTNPNIRHFRGYLRRARKASPPTNGTGDRALEIARKHLEARNA
jgi:hypothetical protein